MKKRNTLLLIWLFSCLLGKAQQGNFRFDFGQGSAAAGYTKVTPSSVYDARTGFGFSGHPKVMAKGSPVKNGVEDDYITSEKPFFFSVKLAEGNYHVKVILGDAQGTSVTTIKAECRRLMVDNIETPKGQFVVREFNVHVKDSIIRGKKISKVRLKAREYSYLHWDDLLTLEFSNAAPKVCAVEITRADQLTTVFLAGNSTVVDQPAEPWAAWGQMIPAFLQGPICIANYAESGETLKDFKGSRRLEKLWSMAKPGDYIFIEFAHNDQKPGSNHLDPFTSYKKTLKEWIAAARKHTVTPVLITSMHRRHFDSSGHVMNSLGDFPEAMREVGAEENVMVLDLNAMSKTLYEAWGPQQSVKAFVHYPANTFPNQTIALNDDTHFNSFGAWELAKCMILLIGRSSLPIKKFIVPGFDFDPEKPDNAAEFTLPSSPFTVSAKPDGN